MSRIRVTGRFFVFIALLLAAVFFVVRPYIRFGPSEAVVATATTSTTHRVQAVIVRDEAVTQVDGNSTVVFTAAEGTQVKPGDAVCDVYSAAYSEKEIARLETVRQDIRKYHATILKNIVDQELDRLDDNVRYKAQELKSIVDGTMTGDLTSIEEQLTQSMQARQTYLSQNRREDSTLTALYDEEDKRQTAITSWKTVKTADRAGTVSFYLDGCEQFLTPGAIGKITAQQLRAVLNGWKPDQENASRLTKSAYRIVGNEGWYLMVLADDASFGAVTGQSFRFQMEGFDDLIYTATVEKVETDGRTAIIALHVADPIGPLIGQRGGWVTVGADLTGLYVPARALVNQNGQTGVVLVDNLGGTFVPVQVLSRDGAGALVNPVAEGALADGQSVKLY